MRREAQLLPRIANWGNMALAFHRAAAGKRSSAEVQQFTGDMDAWFTYLIRKLGDGSWTPGKYRRFLVRDPKLRVIHAAPFPDRVVHHALMNIAGAGFEKGAIDHSFACRKNRGNLVALQHAFHCTQRYRYFLKLDIRRYFDSIVHSTLLGLLRRRFKDGLFLELLGRIVSSFEVTPERGLPIGTLTSQYFANFYLDAMDHWITEELGCRGYARYMDDFILWHDDPAVLEGWRRQVGGWLDVERGLRLKVESLPTPCRQGVPFLGYRILPGRILLGRRARRRFVSRLTHLELSFAAGQITAAELQRRAQSLLAFTQNADCLEWRRRVLLRLPSATDPELEEAL